MRAPRMLVPAALFVLLALCAAPAAATVRHVTPGGSLSDPNCTTTPCNIEHAVGAVAQNDDEVVVAPGNYTITSPLQTLSGRAIDLHGADGQSRPALVCNCRV